MMTLWFPHLGATLLAAATAWIGLAPVSQDPGLAARPARRAPEEKKAAAESFAIDPVHSMALFRVQHLGAGAFWGRFNTVTGTIEHDASAPDGLRLDVAIEIASVDTGSESLDQHLKSPDFFAAEEHGTATFTSRTAKKTRDNMYEVEGDLTMRGVTKPLTVAVEWVGTRAGQRGTRCGFETVFTVKRSDFGINYGVEQGALGNETRIIIAMEAVAGGGQRPGGAARREGGDTGLGRMARFDENGDGKLQKDELPERMRDRFDQIDTNADGEIDAEEIRAAFDRRTGGGNRGGGGTGTGGG